MKLSERAAELFMIGFPGPEPDPGFLSLVGEHGVSGVILFARNLVDPHQVRRLTDSLQGRCRQPLLIATDQEGGVVSRITGREPVRPGNMGRGVHAAPTYTGLAGTAWPGNMTLAACDSPTLAEEIGEGVGRELRALGINMNLAPVLDVNINPANPVIGVRSFGDSPAKVAELGAALIRGLHRGGVLATAKHFPGHGDTHVDSHAALATVPHDLDRLQRVELLPFRRAIGEGVDAIMTAHLIFPAVEPAPGVPATLSRAVLTGLLRNRLRFEGLVITDCLEMRAISESVGVAEAAVQAIAAGADLVLVSHTLSAQREAIAAVRSALESGRIPAQRAADALQRIEALRRRLGDTGPSPGLEILGHPDHQELAMQAAAGSVTAVGNVASLVPIQVERSFLLAVDPSPVVEVEEAQPTGSPVLKAAGRLVPALRREGIAREPSTDSIRQAVQMTSGYDLVVVATYAAHLFPGQVELVRALTSAGRRVLLLPQRGPYDLTAIPEATAAIVIYEDRRLAAEAAVRYLLGIGQAPGRLPVSL